MCLMASSFPQSLKYQIYFPKLSKKCISRLLLTVVKGRPLESGVTSSWNDIWQIYNFLQALLKWKALLFLSSFPPTCKIYGPFFFCSLSASQIHMFSCTFVQYKYFIQYTERLIQFSCTLYLLVWFQISVIVTDCILK